MIIPTSSVDKTLGVHMQKTNKVNTTAGIEPVTKRDVVSISKLSALVEQARTSALSLPDVRTDVVERARAAMLRGDMPRGNDIASAMINRAAKGQV